MAAFYTKPAKTHWFGCSVFILFYTILALQSVSGQQITIRGTVTSESEKEPLIGVSIMVKNDKGGTMRWSTR